MNTCEREHLMPPGFEPLELAQVVLTISINSPPPPTPALSNLIEIVTAPSYKVLLIDYMQQYNLHVAYQ